MNEAVRSPPPRTRSAAPALTLPSFLKCVIKASVSGFPSLPKISPTSKILATGGGTEAQALNLLDMMDFVYDVCVCVRVRVRVRACICLLCYDSDMSCYIPFGK